MDCRVSSVAKSSGSDSPSCVAMCDFCLGERGMFRKEDGRTTIVDEARESAFLIDFVLGFF